MLALSAYTIGSLFALTACRATPSKAPSPSNSSSHPAGSARQPWTPAELRKFVLRTTAIVEDEVRKAYEQYDEKKIAGECWGGPAPRLIEANKVLPILGQRLSGNALRCYVASYFGCRIGDWLARAGVAETGPAAVPFATSPVTIIEQTAERVVADVGEAEVVDVLNNGALDKKKVGNKVNFGLRSRYTLSRDAQNVWHISDRQPSFSTWECRER